MHATKEDLLQRKKNLRWFHSRIENFNNAVPYQMNALSTYRNNIQKQYRLNNFTAVRQERIAADRPIRNLKQLLADVDELRTQVIDTDLDKFDKLVNQSRDRITTALDNFNEYYGSLSLNNSDATPIRRSAHTIDYGSVDQSETSDDSSSQLQKQVLLKIQEDRWIIENQNDVSKEMEKIETDSKALNQMFHDLAKIINDQKKDVDTIEDVIEESHSQVVSAQKELAHVAAKVQGAVYPVVGAVLGSFIGGPIGFLAGLKVGTVMAVTGSVIGFSGGKVLKNRQQRVQKEIIAGSAVVS